MPAVPLESPTKLCPSSPPSPPCLVASRNREAKAKSSCVRCAGSRTNRRKISARSAKSNENIQNKYVREREKKEYSVLERVMAKLVGGCVWQELSHYLVTPLLLRRCHYLVRFSIKIKLPTFRLESILHKWI